MNCIIPGPNVKVLARSINALSRVGDELYMEAKRDKLSVITLNLSKTVCAQFDFLDSFFSSYEVDENEFPEGGDKLSCKIHMKVIHPLFRGNLEKKLEFFKMEYEANSDHMVLKMKYCQDSIMMVHKLRLLDSEILSIGISKDSGRNNLCTSSLFLMQLLTMFCLADDEITLEVNKTQLIARNYCVGAPYRGKTIRSQVNLNPGEFAVYSVEEETSVNFALKPLRTVVHFADGFNLNIGLNFDTGGKPLSMIMKNPTFDASFIVATLNPNSDMQSTMTTTSIPSRVIGLKPNNNDRANITVEDRQALENENWDDFDFETNDNDNGKDKNETVAALKDSDSDKVSNKSSSSAKSLRSNGKKISNSNKSNATKEGAPTGTSGWNNNFIENVGQAVNALDIDIGPNNNINNNNRVASEIGDNRASNSASSKNSENSRIGNRRFVFNPEEEECNKGNNSDNVDDIIAGSPESPTVKRAKIVFRRCYDPTFQPTMLGDILAANSDSE